MPDEEYFGPRILLRQCPARDQAKAYLEGMQWPVVREAGDHGSRESYSLTASVSPGFSLTYVEDFPSRQCYMYVSGNDSFVTQRLALQVSGDFEHYLLDELVADVDRASDPLELGRRIVKLGIGAPYEYQEDVFSRVVSGMRHLDARVRRLSILASAYSPWPQYRPSLREIAQHDPDEALRQRASIALEVFDEHGIGES